MSSTDLRSTIASALAEGKSPDEIVALLRQRGLSEATARRFLANATAGAAAAPATPSRAASPPRPPASPPPAEDEPDGTWRMTIGLFFLALGLSITGLTLLLARPGGKFLLAWGAVAYGLVDLGRGMAMWWRVRDRVGFPILRLALAGGLPVLGAVALLLFSPRGRAVQREAARELERENRRRAQQEFGRVATMPGGRVVNPQPPPDRPVLGNSVPALIEGLSSPEAFTRRTAAQKLGLLEHEAVPALPALTKALGDPDPQVRSTALYALGKIDSAGSTAPFVSRRLADDNPEVRVEAGRALARMGHSSGVDALGKELQSADTHTRELAASALESVDTTRVVPALGHCVTDDSSARARASCVLALRKAGAAAVPALPALAKALQDPDAQVQRWAVMVHGDVTRIAESRPQP